METKVSINLVVYNGEKYIRHCLNGILAQTYPHELTEINFLDNNSADKTKEIIGSWSRENEKLFNKCNLVELTENIGVWPGQEKLLKYSDGKYVLGLCVDVILDKNFIKNAVESMEKDSKIGALQAKIYKYELTELRITSYPDFIEDPRLQSNRDELRKEIIDTLGFQIERSRRITNIGHGRKDEGQFSMEKEIFGVEGACPFFRREALEDCRVQITNSEIFDHDYFWYGDDLDLVWRMNLFGWKQMFIPSVIAWHDRQTSKSLKKNWLDYIFRVPVRQQIPIRKRRLDWRNTRFTIIKNDYIINFLKDLPYITAREIGVVGYSLLFEPKVFMELPNFLKLLPRIIRKRKMVMNKARVSPEEIRKWFK